MSSWTVILSKHLQTQQSARRAPLSDPLESTEWDGLGWVIRQLSRIIGRSGSRDLRRCPPKSL